MRLSAIADPRSDAAFVIVMRDTTPMSRALGTWTRVAHLFDRLRSSYWFVPSVMFITAVALSFGALELDRRWIDAHSEVAWLYLGSAEGARSVLTAIAGSIITVAGVVFSITIVTLAQASTQFGPRILRRFMRDIGNQVVLGTFVATFVYCLLILRTVRGPDEGVFVPHAAVALAVLFAVLSTGVLIYFIHHVATSLQAPMVIDGLGSDLVQAMAGERERFKVAGDAGADRADREPLPVEWTTPGAKITTRGAGYVQLIDRPSLMAVATAYDVAVAMHLAPGDYTIDGALLATARPAERCDDAFPDRIRAAVLLGPERTSEQDVRYALEQAVEIALRALSPGINDPFTAANCIEWLGSALAQIARAPMPPATYRDERGALRLVEPAGSLAQLCDVAFDQIRSAAGGNAWVLQRLVDVLYLVAAQQLDPAGRDVLVEHADRVLQVAERGLSDDPALAAIARRHAAILLLPTNPADPPPEPS